VVVVRDHEGGVAVAEEVAAPCVPLVEGLGVAAVQLVQADRQEVDVGS
jgi:hypothetical protein